MVIDEQNNIYVLNFAYDSLTNYDYVLIKYNSFGVRQWIVKYNHIGNSNDVARKIKIDKNGNLYVTGSCNELGAYKDIVTIKYNNNGVQQWVAVYNSQYNHNDEAKDMAIDSLGNIFITGNMHVDEYNSDIVTIKYNKEGVRQWVTFYSEIHFADDEARAITIDNNGYIYVAGYSVSFESYILIQIVKYDTRGNFIWSRYNHGGYFKWIDSDIDIAVDINNNLIISGHKRFVSNEFTDVITLKYKSNGDMLWAARYESPDSSNDAPTCMILDSLGNIYIAGLSVSTTPIVSIDFLTIKYNSNGVQQWVQKYNGVGNSEDIATAITLDKYGNIYVTGRSIVSIDNFNIVTIKYGTDGSELWKISYNGTANMSDMPSSIALDKNNSVLVAGGSIGVGTGLDMLLIKIAQLVNIQYISNEIPGKYSLKQNYPNPFNPTTTIKFDIQKQGFVTLKVYDLLGKEVSTLVRDNLLPGSYKADFTAEGLTSGVYFYRLVTNDFSDVKRMMLIK